jgi:RNA polymerase sigma-70 factor (ECF subfamily)
MTSTLTLRNRPRPQPREPELIARAQQGEVAAFEQLAQAHADRLFAIALRLVGNHAEAEDVLQETLLRAWRGIGRFHGHSEVFTWLYRFAVNEANRSLEKATRRPATTQIADEQLQLSSPPGDGPAPQAEHRELRAALELALRALPPPYRTAIVLRDIEGLSTREAANIVGVREAAFKSRLHQARLKVRAALGDEALISAAG